MTDTVWSMYSVALSSPKCLSPQAMANGSDLGFVFTAEKFRQEKDSGPSFQSHAPVIEAQVDFLEKDSVVGFMTDLTFGFGKSAGTRISILADVAGTEDSFELGFDAPGTEDALVPLRIDRHFSVQGLHTAGAGSTGRSGWAGSSGATSSSVATSWF